MTKPSECWRTAKASPQNLKGSQAMSELDFTGVCAGCSTSFTASSPRKFCTRACYGAYSSALQSHPDRNRICGYCGCGFLQTPRAKQSGTFCSRACGFAYKGRIKAEKDALMRIGARGKAEREAAKGVVAAAVKNALEALASSIAWVSSLTPHQNVCPLCGENTRVTFGKTSRQRCGRCQRAITPTDRSLQSYKDAKRRSKVKRRAQKRGAKGDAHNIDPLKVFDSFHWRCYLCGVETPQELRGTNAPNAPELDHFVPLSRGGTHTLDNVACACRACNGSKRDSDPYEYLSTLLNVAKTQQ